MYKLAALLLAAASVTSSGAVKVVKGAGSSSVLKSGGSATTFSLALPRNSSCQGDSADANYRVQSFIVPSDTDPGTIVYKSQGPDVPGGWALYMTNTRAFIQEQTANSDNETDPGAILPLPDLSFAVFTGGELAAGRYHVGVACSLFNETTKYWATDVVLTTDPSDKPAHLRWRLADASSSDDGGGGGNSLLPVAVVGLIALVALAVVMRRRAAMNGGDA